MKIQAYIYHKRAEKYSECQDYFGIESQNNRIAVSDGMSQSIYPQWWAEILVEAYLNLGKIPDNLEELKRYQDVWQDRVQEEILKREKSGKNPWRLKNSFMEKSGAGATLCGFTWNDNSWSCECIGDTSLIVVRNDFSIEIKSSQQGEFGNQPDYLDSFKNGRGGVKSHRGEFDDVFTILLVTDPFAELFQKYRHDVKFIEERISEINSLSDHESYSKLVEEWRDEYFMHNDDSTLIVLTDFTSNGLQYDHIDNLKDLIRKESKNSISSVSGVNNSSKTVSLKQPTSNCNGISQMCPTKEEERQRTIEEFRKAAQNLLKYYIRKRKPWDIFRFFKNYLNPIIKNFCKK